MRQKRKLMEQDWSHITANDVKKYFDVSNVTITAEGVSADSLYSKPGVKLTAIPFKLHEVEEFDIEHYTKINTFENFPSKAGSIEMSGNTALTSLAGADNIDCEKFTANECKLQNLAGCPQVNEQCVFNFQNCKDLTSTYGLSLLKSVSFHGCTSLTNINSLTALVSSPGKISLPISEGSNMPIIYMTLVSGLANHHEFDFKTKDTAITQLLMKYKGSGLSNAMELTKALLDLGKAEYARLYLA
jgi:hypothetical protein